VRGSRKLLADAFKIIARVENPDRHVNMVVPQRGAVREIWPAISARFSTSPAKVFGRSLVTLAETGRHFVRIFSKSR
jgi:hypothetical protein